MEAYGGFEPQVGEIRALRTFRIGPDGRLYALFGDQSWGSGVNTAFCRLPPPADHGLGRPLPQSPHPAPDPDCGCGFYAYADDGSAGEYRQSRHVLAVISCWGHLIAGTRGVRAEHARIEALWMSPTVPAELQAAVAARYPDVSRYGAKATMLAEHPPTLLDCYEIPSPGQRLLRKRVFQSQLLTALVLGLLPASWIWHHQAGQLIWGAALAWFGLGAAFFGLTAKDRHARGSALLCAAVTLWLIAPFAGSTGMFLLRLPILQIALLERVHSARLNREASRFPAPITPG